MPPKGYVSITIRKDVYEKLEKLKTNLGYSSVSNLLVFLVEFYSNNVDTKKEVNRCIETLNKFLNKPISESTRGD